MSATKTAYQAFVGGEWVDSASGETMEVIAPATGEVIAEVPRCGAKDVDRAVEAAKAVLPEWLEKTPTTSRCLPAGSRNAARRSGCGWSKVRIGIMKP